MKLYLRIQSFLRFYIKLIIALMPGNVFRLLRNIIWRLLGFKVDYASNIMCSADLICGDIYIGKDTFIGYQVIITGGDIHIGNNCDIAPRVIIHAGSHMIGDKVRRAGASYYGNIVIGDGTWVGTNSTILDGAVIGSGVVVAAGSVVVKGIYPDNCLLAGIPAKCKKYY